VVDVTVLTLVLVTLATTVLLVVVAIAVILRVLYKRIRRGRALTGAVLRARARLSWGPQKEVMKLRVRLHETLDGGQAAVDLAMRSNVPRGELPRLFRRVHSEGAALESQLRLMESENDPAVLAEAIAVASRRVDEVVGLVRQLRSVVAAGLGDLTDDSLATLRSDVDREVAALHAGVQELNALNGNDGWPDAHRQPSMYRIKGNRS
jgi:hypothetical protein